MKAWTSLRICAVSCVDPDCFVRGGPGEGGFKYHYQRAATKRHLNGFRWRADDGPRLNIGVVAL